MRRTIVRERTPRQHLLAQQAALELTQRQILQRLQDPPFNLPVSLDKVNHLFTGRLPLEKAAAKTPDVLAAFLIVLEIYNVAEVGLTPAQAPITHLILEGYRAVGLPPVPPSDETKTTHTYPSRDLLLADQAA